MFVFRVLTVLGAAASIAALPVRTARVSQREDERGHVVQERREGAEWIELYKPAERNATGLLDGDFPGTKGRPRCGVRDSGVRYSGKSERYKHNGSRWQKRRITYRITQYPDSLPAALVDEAVARAFAAWREVVELSFAPVAGGRSDIELLWAHGQHGDGYPFDGRGGVLAHAVGAPEGYVHFDSEEAWGMQGDGSHNLYQTAVHEIGHALGLSHSALYGTVMYPYAYGYDPDFGLQDDDIAGIQALYGKRSAPPTPRPPATVNRQLCEEPTVDAMLLNAQGDIYVFKGDLYYTLSDAGVAPSPRRMSDTWPGVPGDIDAAFSYSGGKIYFFKGARFWKFEGARLASGYPKLIADSIPGAPADLDTAFVWGATGIPYFFKGSQFWKLGGSSRASPLSAWRGVPPGLDAALGVGGTSYFVRGASYYRFVDSARQVVEGPLPLARWFGCDALNSTLPKTL